MGGVGAGAARSAARKTQTTRAHSLSLRTTAPHAIEPGSAEEARTVGSAFGLGRDKCGTRRSSAAIWGWHLTNRAREAARLPATAAGQQRCPDDKSRHCADVQRGRENPGKCSARATGGALGMQRLRREAAATGCPSDAVRQRVRSARRAHATLHLQALHREGNNVPRKPPARKNSMPARCRRPASRATTCLRRTARSPSPARPRGRWPPGNSAGGGRSR